MAFVQTRVKQLSFEEPAKSAQNLGNLTHESSQARVSYDKSRVSQRCDV